MVNLNSIVQGLSKSGAVSGFAGGLAGTALAGALSGKKGKKVAKSALKVGALAAVGGLAYTAYQRYQQNGATRAAPPVPATARTMGATGPALQAGANRWDNIGRERFESVVAEESTSSGGLLLVRAMIAAAAADGHMDSAEQARIFGETERMDLAPEEKAQLFDELRHPLSLAELVQQVHNPETAVEVYAASLVAIDESQSEGQAYLRDLAAALELPDELVASVHSEVRLAQQDKAA